MSDTLDFATGPLFRATLLVMVLGLARLVLLRTIAIFRARRRTPPRPLPWGQVATRLAMASRARMASATPLASSASSS